MSEKVDKVEVSLLDLGAEVFKLRGQVFQVVQLQEKLTRALKGLRGILDEKGFISTEDFDSAVDLTEFQSSQKSTAADLMTDSSPDWRKRDTH